MRHLTTRFYDMKYPPHTARSHDFNTDGTIPASKFFSACTSCGRRLARVSPCVVEIIRGLPLDVKRSVKQAIRSLSADPFSGAPLMGELSGLWKFKVRRFRIVYELDRKTRIIRIYAIGHRREVYEELADRLRRAVAKK